MEERTERRTTEVIIDGKEKIHLCEPECRNEFLLDLGVSGGTGAWVFRSRGSATVVVGWSGKRHQIGWRRIRPNARDCDLCGVNWRGRVPAAILANERKSEAMRGNTRGVSTRFK